MPNIPFTSPDKPKYINRNCEKHGETEFVLEGRGYYRCKKCRIARANKSRGELKVRLVAHFGGKCIHCGYDRCVGALHFHHRDPSEKEFGLAANGNIASWKRMLAEASKCDLICGNCHAEVHAGLI